MYFHLSSNSGIKLGKENISVENTNRDFEGLSDIQDTPYLIEFENQFATLFIYLSKKNLEKLIAEANFCLLDEQIEEEEDL